MDSAEDAAWETMSYTDRFLWYLDNKILKNDPKQSASVETAIEKLENEPTVGETVEGPTIELPPVKAEELPIAKAEEIPAESVNEQPSPKKRSSKGKKISIEM